MDIKLIPPNGNVKGKDLKHFIKKYWEEVCPISKKNNPIWDNDGSNDESFNNKVKEDLFMLSPSMSPQQPITRRITVPKNKGLFIPIVPVVATDCETDLPIVAAANNDQSSINPSTLSLKLDDTSISLNDLNKYKFNPNDIGEFTVTFPSKEEEAVFTIIHSKDSCNAVAAGRYLWTEPLQPLPSGKKYIVHYTGKLRCSPPRPSHECLEKKYDEDITYEITVSQ